MKREWFESTVKGWSKRIRWVPADLKRATDILCEISTQNGGALLKDVELPSAAEQAFAVTRADEVLSRRVIRYMASLRHSVATGGYREPVATTKAPRLGFLEPHAWHPAVDLNIADQATIEALPGIGHGIASQILTQRYTEGPLRTTDDLDRIARIGPKVLEGLRWKIVFGDSLVSRFSSPTLQTLLQTPNFAHYVALIVESRGSFLQGRRGETSVSRLIVDELEDIREEGTCAPSPRGRGQRLTRASQVLQENQRQHAVEVLADTATTDIRFGVLLKDGHYREFVEQLLPQATKRLYVALFLLRFEDQKNYVTDQVVAELIAANKRGVDVRVILDRDQEHQVYHSRIVNQEAYRHLKRNKVAIRFDTQDRLMHSKVIVLDSHHVVLGSHNWTAGSFYAYDDTSLYVESKALATHYSHWFVEFWKTLEA
jgi:hypothetical protein